MFHDMNEWGWGMGFGWFFMLLFWALVILGIVAIAKRMAGGSGGARPKTAIEILQERYARGEIDQQEYQQKRRDLES